jgi:hypothetical protein
MEQPGQNIDLYLSSPDESEQRKLAVPALVGLSLVVAGIVGVFAANRPAVPSPATMTEIPDASADAVLAGASGAVLPAPRVVTRVTEQSPTVTNQTPNGSGCASARAWLAGHSAPGFRFECPGYALGHQAMTCADCR